MRRFIAYIVVQAKSKPAFGTRLKVAAVYYRKEVAVP
jgi:hypothetical protein